MKTASNGPSAIGQLTENGQPRLLGDPVRRRVFIVLLATLALTLANNSAPYEYLFARKVVQYLYFLPIFLAALWFGWRGAVLSAAFAAVCYLPDVLWFWARPPGYTTDQYGEVLDLFLVGIIAGALADRERNYRMMLERTTRELSNTYRELQENFEHLKRAERLSAIGQLSASLAHEIRNPLASIEGAADLLKPGGVDEDMRGEFVQIIKKECRRLSKLLTELLDFARPRPPEFARTGIEPIIDNVFDLVTVSAHKTHIELQRRIAPDLPEIECDPEQIKQVLLNLMMNAVQALEQAGNVTISADVRDNRLVIEVSDDGPGVPLEDVDRLFSPFYTTKPHGTGLGLPVAQQIVLRHGGVIMVGPNSPRGAVFSVMLPLERPRA